MDCNRNAAEPHLVWKGGALCKYSGQVVVEVWEVFALFKLRQDLHMTLQG